VIRSTINFFCCTVKIQKIDTSAYTVTAYAGQLTKEKLAKLSNPTLTNTRDCVGFPFNDSCTPMDRFNNCKLKTKHSLTQNPSKKEK